MRANEIAIILSRFTNTKSVLAYITPWVTFYFFLKTFVNFFREEIKNKLNFHVCCFFRRFSLKFTKRFAQLIEGRDRHHIRLNFVFISNLKLCFYRLTRICFKCRLFFTLSCVFCICRSFFLIYAFLSSSRRTRVCLCVTALKQIHFDKALLHVKWAALMHS